MEPSMRRLSVLLVTLAATSAVPASPQTPQILVKAGRLIDGRSDVARSNVGILVAADRINAEGALSQAQPHAGAGAPGTDLAPRPVRRGPTSTHTRLPLHGGRAATP